MSRLKNQRIAVLAGGPSCERGISLISGKCVFDALSSKGLSVTRVDPVNDFIPVLKKASVTLVFIALHGTFGEDGTVQGLLDQAGIPYTGSGARASEIAFDKVRAQALFKKSGIRIPEFHVLKKKYFSAACAFSFSFPFIVKPSKAGSSIGVSIVTQESEYEAAVLDAFRYSEEVLIEQYIRGRELTVGILADEALPVVEVIAKRKFYDYEAKYNDAGTRYECPAKLEPARIEEVSAMAVKACRLVGCEVMARADLILSEDGAPYLLEINTIPGLTGKSLLPKAAEARGIDFPDLCVKILESSMDKTNKTKRKSAADPEMEAVVSAKNK